ncbi:hypothetical protein [Mycobacterium sp. E802]|uniref:hypothetical protein n=1 Tax=Mycobacterium sp. E802 TaxID=1834152 RepID=UPI001E2DF8C0|nr:hypothetical protein [Mycobacterium sp. E802]
MAMKPWDGDRPQTPRVVLEQHDVAARGLSFTFATEQISAPTDWCSFDPDNHLMYVYRHGSMRSMDTLLDWGPSGRVPPSAGDIWWKPGGIPCAALVQGDVAGYCEITIPGRAIGDAALIPRVKYKNSLVHQLVEEIYSVAGREDAIARLLTDSLAETLRLLIIDTYTAPAPARNTSAPIWMPRHGQRSWNTSVTASTPTSRWMHWPRWRRCRWAPSPRRSARRFTPRRTSSHWTGVSPEPRHCC